VRGGWNIEKKTTGGRGEIPRYRWIDAGEAKKGADGKRQGK